MNQPEIEQLKFLYGQSSKHSNYQILAECLKPLLEDHNIDVKSRYEKERLAYMLRHIDPSGKSILDIGGNSGYFSFELLEKGADHVDYYEGNQAHAEFVRLAAGMAGYADKLKVYNEYYDFYRGSGKQYDIVLLLNVLHHIGDDYTSEVKAIEDARNAIITQLNNMNNKTQYLVFQLGFNWKGNRDSCLFDQGTKEELIEFIKKGITGYWEVLDIGIAEKAGESVTYNEINGLNIKREDTFGEFLNRPIFILRSEFKKR